jgi:hypothetical protein
MPANHNIHIPQGDTLNLHILYQDEISNGIDLTNHKARMQVRKSPTSSSYLLFVDSTPGLTYGITGSTGGIHLNVNKGNTGSQTGGILLVMGATATSFVPAGKHHYDLELENTTDGSIRKLIYGSYDSQYDVTR